MIKQFFLLVFFMVGLALIEACSCFTTCGCKGPDEPPQYFDLQTMLLEHKQDIGTESLRFILEPDSLSFLAFETPASFGPALLPAAYGCSPAEPGAEGLKFPIQSLRITANQSFNDTLPAGSLLNPLFQMAANVYGEDDVFITPNQLSGLNDLNRFPPFGSGPNKLFLTTSARPSSAANPFTFTITLVKGDSTEIEVKSGEIFF